MTEKLTMNEQDKLTFKEFIDIINNNDNAMVVTTTYDAGNIQMNTVMEDALIGKIEDGDLSIDSHHGTEFTICSDAIHRITAEGFDPIIDKNVYRIDLHNGKVIYISVKEKLV